MSPAPLSGWISMTARLSARQTKLFAGLIVVGLLTFLTGTPGRAQLGPLPGLSALSLGQPNGPAKLGSDGSATSLTALGRTLGARASDRVNILDAPYNAKCDGALVNGAWLGGDDTVAVASALAAAIAQHKALYIPGGTGYCLMRTGNPLTSFSGSLTITGDGKDVSRLVWFLDDPKGSLAGVVSPGANYVVGDFLTVVGGTASGAAMRLKVLAVNASGGITAATAWGTPSYSTMPPLAAATAGGTGTGATVNVVAGGPAIGTAFQPNAANRIPGVTLQNFSIIGQGQQNPVQSNCLGAMAIGIYSTNDLTIEGVGVDYSRCMAIAVRNSQGATITHNRIRWSSRDGINTSSPWAVITDNTLEHVGDDGIAITDFASELGGLPAREGVVVAGNFMTDTQGIVALGAAGVSITGNTLVRPKNRAINVSTGASGEGSTPTRVVHITGNAISDLLSVAGDPISQGGPTKCILVGSTPALAGTAPGIPGFPVAATGEFISPYPYMTANGLASGQPTPPGLYVTIGNNSCVRTINASPNSSTRPIMFSSLGFGLVYGAAGWLDFPVLHSSVAEGIGIEIEQGIVQNLKVIGNTFGGLLYGIDVLGNAQLIDAEFIQNTFRDMTTFGVAWTSPVAPNQRIVFDNNLWDGDPYFTSANRTSSGTAADGNPLLTGTWSGGLPQLTFQTPPGAEWRNNRIRNWAGLGPFPPTDRLIANTLYANNGTGIGGPLPSLSEGWDIITEDGTPTSATFGQVLGSSGRDLTTGCLAGRYASTPGANQCITPGPGVAISGTGVLSTALASNLASQLSGAVKSISAAANAGGYVLNLPGITVSAPPAGGTQATAVVTAMGMGSWSTVSGGSGYAVGQYLVLNGGTCSVAPTLVINSVNGSGGVTATGGANPGNCTILPNPYTMSSTPNIGTGSGATFNVSWFIENVAITNAGSGYVTAPSVTFAPTTSNLPFSATATGTATIYSTVALGTAGANGLGIVSQGTFADASKVRFSATGVPYVVPANTSWLALVQTGIVPSQMITLPTAPVDGQILRISTTGTVTALTLNPNVPAWANGSRFKANTGFALGWDAASSTWLPLTNAELSPNFQTLPFTPTLTEDVSLGPIASVTLTGNLVLTCPINMQPGGTYQTRLAQDANGGHTWTPPSCFHWPGGSAGILSTAANSTDVLTFTSFDGTTAAAVLSKAFQ